MWMDVGMGTIDGVGDMNGNWGARYGRRQGDMSQFLKLGGWVQRRGLSLEMASWNLFRLCIKDAKVF